MSRKWVVAVMVLMPVLSQAQSNPDSATYRRAQTLVNDGNAAAGRAVVDSMIARATPGTSAYAEGLYWRAVLSATASDAEMDYRRIVVDYPLSPRVEDVLLRLAQLELARADYDGALQHLNRLTLEHPASVMRARAGYWTARVLFEKNDVQRACAVNADALARTSVNDTELRNQISYLNQRCAGVVIAAAPTATPSTIDSTSRSVAAPVAPPAAAPVTAPVNTPVSSPTVAPKSGPTGAQSTTASSKPSMQPPSSPRDVNPSMIVPSTKEGAPTEKTVSSTAKTTPSSKSSSEGGYSVQVAAYNVKSQAQAMVDKLKKKGYDARVSGTSAPFRVRIGNYATQAQASAVMRSLKAKQIEGFVVKAE
jgi:cell division protein FtsN